MHDGAARDDHEDDSRILDAVHAKLGATCACGAELGGEDLIHSIALGFKDSPRCLARLADGLGRGQDELRTDLGRYVARQECYRRAWTAVEGWTAQRQTACLGGAVDAAVETKAVNGAAEDYWDAGDMSCGDLVLALRKRLANLRPGACIAVRALDPAAPMDLPAWCRLTGHSLRSADHPNYTIARKEN
jgi:tRNA 2-thiouridine synthesizing protein A